MNVNSEWLSQQTRALGERVSTLLQHAHSNSLQHPELLSEALEELGTSLEELRMSQEVLNQQNQELLEAHAALEVERQRYQELFEFAPDGYLITDSEGNIQEANHAASLLLKVPQKYLIGKPLTVFVPQPEHGAFWNELNRLQQVERLSEWIIRLQPRGAHPFDAALTVTTMFDSKGNSVGLRWLLRDISERKQLEAAQLQNALAEMTNQALEAEIVRRRQLEQELRQQAESLNQASTLKDEFLAIVSHELRSPLNAMLGWTQMLRNKQLNESMVARGLETIERNARAQVKLVEDLLDISRIIRGKLFLNIRPINLVSVIQAAIKSAQPAFTAKNIQIRTVLDESATFVLGDGDRLQQIVWNLLANSTKFTPQHGLIEVRLERIATNAVITVSDTGEGIRSNFLPYVFDRFRQAEQATTRCHGGLGLGLAIVRQLVEIHGGTVEADSPGEGQGATFTVTLPLLVNKEEVRGWEEIYPSNLSPFHPLLGLQVLVVDDEADNREWIAVVLKDAGANVKTVTSANEALQVIQQSQPDILISDVRMPEQDGYALIRQVREIESERPNLIPTTAKHAHLPAIALTAYDREDDDRKQLLDAGFQLQLPKPVEPTALVAAVVSQIKCV
ncbi:response regulator [Leptolyngbya sp. FACHB-541]|uniref:ATP-binding protein n=1 Tax=Leptolyngbya sp. FACHB-541 TaxID=2692810 RepID=UPI0016822336|nr:response regulator [Leptolyngbya sp. FACHB-541]